ncbi:hypothetical protein DM872_06550 [Pseudomonas taiwanensis]|uniref:hypothetical protein n=1 Tax=Pseudomonas taiwanensis TaxID=470150 RepID=UPI0015BBE82B|nr:hypothetical protein [Pseudomonas taiwanensis]NWL76508.1 hypothetical protein [Pseudomonas taiwanensis]
MVEAFAQTVFAWRANALGASSHMLANWSEMKTLVWMFVAPQQDRGFALSERIAIREKIRIRSRNSDGELMVERSRGRLFGEAQESKRVGTILGCVGSDKGNASAFAYFTIWRFDS